MAGDADTANPTANSRDAVADKQVRYQSSKAAEKSQQAQKKAQYLKEAAAGAADPEARQKLLEQAIDKEIEAESFGKTAKYLRTGTFQGMIMGLGLGVVPGLTLGALVGVLAGGVVSILTGGLGAGLGALTGAIHGPFWNMGEVAGKSIQRITGNFPGWKATDAQKRTLENMVGQINDLEMPDQEELEIMKRDDGSEPWSIAINSYFQSMPPWMKKYQESGARLQNDLAEAGRQQQDSSTKIYPATQKAGNEATECMITPQGIAHSGTNPVESSPRAMNLPKNSDTAGSQSQTRKKPRKLEVRSGTRPIRESHT